MIIKKTMTKEAISQIDILPLLPRGALKDISQTTGLDRNSVRSILRGYWNNPVVVEAAVSILKRQREQIDLALRAMAMAKE
jgi:hypothetical protein